MSSLELNRKYMLSITSRAFALMCRCFAVLELDRPDSQIRVVFDIYDTKFATRSNSQDGHAKGRLSIVQQQTKYIQTDREYQGSN